MEREDLLSIADAVRRDRYGAADAVFAAGSLIRGEGTVHSDLDLVIVYAALPCAYRESFTSNDMPVEVFVHDPDTLDYFFTEVDRKSGIPALAQMVIEGVELPSPSDGTRILKQRAAAVMALGPPELDDAAERSRRYLLTDLVDDLRGARSREEEVAISAKLFEELGDFELRRNGRWSGRGKGLVRALRDANPDLTTRLTDAMGEAMLGKCSPLITVTEQLLEAAGGRLFDGYRADAPATWRSSASIPARAAN